MGHQTSGALICPDLFYAHLCCLEYEVIIISFIWIYADPFYWNMNTIRCDHKVVWIMNPDSIIEIITELKNDPMLKEIWSNGKGKLEGDHWSHLESREICDP